MSDLHSINFKEYKENFNNLRIKFSKIEYISKINFIKISFFNINKLNNNKFTDIFLSLIKIFTRLIFSIFINDPIKKKHVNENLIISYATKSKKESYFEDLENFFIKNKQPYTKILIPNNSKLSKRVYEKSLKAYVIELSSIDNIVNETKILIKNIKSIFYILINDEIIFKEKLFLIYGILDAKSISDLRIFEQINKISKKNEIKNIFIPFEGHIYERLICEKINKKIFAFQIAPLFSGTFSIKNLTNAQIPDVLITLSHYYKYKYEALFPDKKNNIFSRGNKNFNNVKNIVFKPNQDINIVLSPEGIYEEVFLFIDFVAEKINYNKKINLYISLHPIIDINLINNYLKKYANLKFTVLKNADFISSTNTFSLYSGSSSIIKHMANGYIPLYFDRNFDEINPLYEYKKYIPSISYKNSFTETIDNFSRNFIDERYIYQNKIDEIINLIEPTKEDTYFKILNNN